MTTATVLRAAGHVFVGWGSDETETLKKSPKIEEPRETVREYGRVPVVMIVPPMVLSLFGIAFSFIPGLPSAVDLAAKQMMDRSAYASRVLDGISIVPLEANAREMHSAGTASAIAPMASALGVAFLILFRDRMPFHIYLAPAFLMTALNGLRRLHSGRVGDYVTWLTLGVAALGALFAFLLG
jgi:multicomponent Na+:H+ antiporter subunit D